jgi:hypothetical protein
MDSNIIQDAIESGDPSAASEAIREIDSRVQRLTSSEEKAGLLLNTAVLLALCQAGKTRLGSSRREARSQSMFIPIGQWPTAFRYNEPSLSSPHAI